jgi:hypothetical protein
MEMQSITFLAKSRLRGYRDLIVGSEIVPTKGSKGYDKFMQKTDFCWIVDQQQKQCLFGLGGLKSVHIDAWGRCKVVLDEFGAETCSNNIIKLIKTKREFVEFRLEDISMDRDIWTQGLEILRRRLEILGHKVSEMDLIIDIIHNLPREYEMTIQFIENELEVDTVTFLM